MSANPQKEPLFAIPNVICPHCLEYLALNPESEGIRTNAAGAKIWMAEGRCSCRVWNVSLPPVIAVARAQVVEEIEKPGLHIPE